MTEQEAYKRSCQKEAWMLIMKKCSTRQQELEADHGEQSVIQILELGKVMTWCMEAMYPDPPKGPENPHPPLDFENVWQGWGRSH
jgi:hypothetical protein